MGLGYTYQNVQILLGTRTTTTIVGEELESTYAADATKVMETGGMSKVNFNIRYTMGAAETTNSIEIRISTSPTSNVFYQIVNENVSSGTSTLLQREFTIVGVDASNRDFSLPLDIQDEYLKIEFKETGASSNKGKVFCEATLSGDK